MTEETKKIIQKDLPRNDYTQRREPHKGLPATAHRVEGREFESSRLRLLYEQWISRRLEEKKKKFTWIILFLISRKINK